MSAPERVDVLAVATTEDSSVVPAGLIEVSRDVFWANVLPSNVSPAPERRQTWWRDAAGRVWGWTSRGFAGPFDHEGAPPERFALARVGGGA